MMRTTAHRPIRRRLSFLCVVVILSSLVSCNLVVFDEDGVRAARRADEMDQERIFEIAGWDEYDDDVILHPDGFLPDSKSSASGYLIARTEEYVVVVRVEDATVTDREDVLLDETRGAFGWGARVVPAAANPVAGYTSSLILTLAGDPYTGEGDTSINLLYPEPGTSGRLINRGIDVASILAAEAFPNRLVAAVQTVTVATNGGAGEIQLLAWEDGGAGVYQEFFVTVSGDELARWDYVDGQSNPALLSYLFVAGSATFPRIQRSDGYVAYRISYGNARLSDTNPNDRRGYLTFADGDYTAAPLKTYSWLTDVGVAVPAEVSEWQYPFQSVTVAGTLRNALTGTIVTIDARAPVVGQTSAEDHGALWYAGQYPDGSALVDVYSAIGLSRSVGEWTLSVALYED
jgi:hypothetical protein